MPHQEKARSCSCALSCGFQQNESVGLVKSIERLYLAAVVAATDNEFGSSHNGFLRDSYVASVAALYRVAVNVQPIQEKPATTPPMLK
jgi:hypothetical protein